MNRTIIRRGQYIFPEDYPSNGSNVFPMKLCTDEHMLNQRLMKQKRIYSTLTSIVKLPGMILCNSSLGTCTGIL